MKLYKAVVENEAGNWMDTEWGERSSLAFKIEGDEKKYRIWVNKGTSKADDVCRYRRGQEITVVQQQGAKGKYWEIVETGDEDDGDYAGAQADDGLPFDKPQTGKSSSGKSPKKEETPEEKQARLEAKAKEIGSAINNGSRILAKCYVTVIAEYEHERNKIIEGSETKEEQEDWLNLFDIFRPSAAEIQSMAVSLFIHIDRTVKF